MKLIRLTLSFIFMSIFYSSVSFAVEITTDEDLQTDTRILAHSLAFAHFYATNCQDEEALNRISVLKRRALELYADKGFSKSTIYELSDDMDHEIKEERRRRSTITECDKVALDRSMKSLETDYKYLEETLQHYIMPY